MKRNVELLQQTMQHILDHPEQHNQESFWTVCGTPSCFAGWALHFSGLTYQQVCNSRYSTPEYAGRVLGLSVVEQEYMFHACNTVPMLQLMVKDLVNGDPMRDWDDYKV